MKKPIPFGKYYLLERINVGGMAEVFRAKAYGVEGFERLVAVKRILPNIAEDKEFIGMFIDEAKIAVQLNHANIAQIFDLGVVDSSYYIALEHIHGRDLRAIFDRCNEKFQPMPIAQAAFVIMKVCEGLDYAHNKRDAGGGDLNLVHRDVSPQNLLVSFEGEVKIIDFGIAKAAGKGSKTQAGILKGKFGYMSPEQVRGLPIDRRSDIFSCGIVLYELLTGERLFVGESDFSTLEKVRNVEILPPSTYNRKIPDELERIVLKALAKDVEDRYQNAIDLHDELQAFVYTAGEFYSRKDLASWMKDTFAREIEEETAKLESYRHFRPPAEVTNPSLRPAPKGRPTLSLNTAKPPPMPSLGRPSGPVPTMGNRQKVNVPSYAQRAAAEDDGLAWDDDELETQIYDSPDDLQPGIMPAIGGNAPAPMSHRPSGPAGALPSLGSLASGPGAHTLPGPPGPPLGQPGLSNPGLPMPGGPPAQGWDISQPGAPPPPANLAVGSNQSPSPFADSTGIDDSPLISPFDTITPGESIVAPKKSRKGLVLFLLALLIVGGGGAGAYFLLNQDQDKSEDEVAATDPGQNPGTDAGTNPVTDPVTNPVTDAGTNPVKNPVTDAVTSEILAKTGFTLIVQPANAVVKLDGEVLDAKPPIQMLNVKPGDHKLTIEGPKGFFSKNQTIKLTAGEVTQLNIKLDGLDVAATFTSKPDGAEVTLIENGAAENKLGPAPAKATINPSKSYQVRFEKKGYETKTLTVAFSGDTEQTILGSLRKKRTTPKNTGDGGKKVTKPAGKGTLMLGSKPRCDIIIDGKKTGLKTPQRSISLPAGKHRITLINKDFGIKESFSVTVKANESIRRIKDLSDRIK